jgi:hypothetical protein
MSDETKTQDQKQPSNVITLKAPAPAKKPARKRTQPPEPAASPDVVPQVAGGNAAVGTGAELSQSAAPAPAAATAAAPPAPKPESDVIRAIRAGTFVGVTGEPTNEQYHALGDYLGSSRLWTCVSDGPVAYKYVIDNPTPPSDAQRLGTAIHSLALEPHLNAVMIDPEVIAKPRHPNRPKDQKTLESAAYKEKLAEHAEAMAEYDRKLAAKAATYAGKILLTPEEFEEAHALAKRLAEAEEIQLLGRLRGVSEVSMYTQCVQTGLKVKCRVDRYYPEQNMGYDFKTTSAKNLDEFLRQCVNLGYVHKVAHYLDVGNAATGGRLQQLPIIALQTVGPREVWCVYFKQEDLDFARTENHAAKQLIRKCMETGVWRRPVRGFQQATLPVYFRTPSQIMGEVSA